MKIYYFLILLFSFYTVATPLTEAVKANDLVQAEQLLQQGTDVNQKDITGYTPLMIAAGLGNYQMCELLLTAGADLHILDNRMGASALHKAAQGGEVPVAELLIRRGAFIDLQAPTHGHTPLMDASWHRKPAMVEYLLSAGANWDILASDGSTAKSWAQWAKDEHIVKIFERYEAKRAQYIQEQEIFTAVENNDIEAVKKLIAKGVDVNQKAKFRVSRRVAKGTTPLLVASLSGYTEIVELLLASGANTRIVDWLMKSTVVHKSGYKGHPKVIRKVVASGGEIDAQGPYNGYTALHDAVWHGHTSAAQALIDSGARLNLRGHDGATPRDLAVEYGYKDIIKILDTKTKSPQEDTSAYKEIASSKRQWTGIAVSKQGRVFVNYPNWSDPHTVSVAELKNGKPVPFPNESWNSSEGPEEERLICVQSVYVDKDDDLWILDTGNPKFQGRTAAAKLLKVNLANNIVVRTYVFSEEVAKKASYLNDVRVDTASGFAYLTDSGDGAIIVLDLTTGKARRLLDDHFSTEAEDITLIIDGEAWVDKDGNAIKVHSDGIALSPDNQTLYYQALTGRTMYRLATKYLRQEDTSNLGSYVEEFATSGASDGLICDTEGNIYISSLERNAICVLTPEGEFATVVQSEDISWPDSFSFSQGKIYFTTAHIHLGFGDKSDPEHKIYWIWPH